MVWHHFLFFLGFLTFQPGGDDLHFSQPLANLGEARTYLARSHSFAFVNRGSQPIDILACEASCGCMIVHLPPRRYQAGEKGTLIVEIKPSSQPPGPHSWFAKVRYRVGDREQIAQVQVQATICREVSVTPSVLAWNGSGDFRDEIVVTDQRGSPLTVKAVHFSSPIAKAQIVSSEKGVTRIVLQSAADLPAGRRDEVLSIYTDDPLYEQLQLPVALTGQCRQRFAVMPQRIEQRVVENGSLPSTLVRVRPLGDTAVAIKQVTASDPAIVCTWASAPFNGATLRVRIDVGKLAGRSLDGSVRVQLTEPAGEELVIPVQISR